MEVSSSSKKGRGGRGVDGRWLFCKQPPWMKRQFAEISTRLSPLGTLMKLAQDDWKFSELHSKLSRRPSSSSPRMSEDDGWSL
ncbi:hypothetical protein MLD38_037012 [Melastoma candidum]|uniref:Uncharacterized protein n=1 Tax=Melastoma candidum TaxID=119954 RepID=A0ACB9LLP2_9MYRT|nr:hypothetical protein MLD38_037012 [Melastoma candidum]